MRPFNSLGYLLAASLFAAPALAAPPAGGPAKAAAAAKQNKGAKREARLIEAMKKQGISETKAKQVVAVVKKTREEMRPVRSELKSAKQALKKNANDAAAKKRLEAAKQKRAAIRQKKLAELAKILTPAEQEKVKKILRHGKRNHHRNRRSA